MGILKTNWSLKITHNIQNKKLEAAAMIEAFLKNLFSARVCLHHFWNLKPLQWLNLA